jgi:hypothetical protein
LKDRNGAAEEVDWRIGPSICCFSDTTKRMGCVAIHKSVGWSSMSLMVGGGERGMRESKGREGKWSASEVADVSWECETN